MVNDREFDGKIACVSSHGWFTVYSVVASPEGRRYGEIIAVGLVEEIGLQYDSAYDQLRNEPDASLPQKLSEFWASMDAAAHSERVKIFRGAYKLGERNSREEFERWTPTFKALAQVAYKAGRRKSEVERLVNQGYNQENGNRSEA